MIISSYLWVKGEKKRGEKEMKALERTSLHLTSTINICNELTDSVTCENYNNLVKILI